MNFSEFPVITMTLSLLVVIGCSVADNETLQLKSDYRKLESRFSSPQTVIEISSETEVYTDSFNELTLKIRNTGTTNIAFGEPLYIERLKQGPWYQVPYREDFAFADIGLGLEPDNTSSKSTGRFSCFRKE